MTEEFCPPLTASFFETRENEIPCATAVSRTEFMADAARTGIELLAVVSEDLAIAMNSLVHSLTRISKHPARQMP